MVYSAVVYSAEDRGKDVKLQKRVEEALGVGGICCFVRKLARVRRAAWQPQSGFYGDNGCLAHLYNALAGLYV